MASLAEQQGTPVGLMRELTEPRCQAARGSPLRESSYTLRNMPKRMRVPAPNEIVPDGVLGSSALDRLQFVEIPAAGRKRKLKLWGLVGFLLVIIAAPSVCRWRPKPGRRTRK